MSRALAVWLGVAVSLVFGGLAVREVEPDELWSALRATNYAWLAPALAVFALGIFLRAVRWRYLFAPPTRPPLAQVTSSMLLGCLFNNILPLQAGEAARILALNKAAGTSRSETAATVVLERTYDVLTHHRDRGRMILPSSPAAVGVFEAATVVALAAYGMDESQALSYALVLHALNFVPFLVVGFPLLHRRLDVRRAAA